MGRLIPVTSASAFGRVVTDIDVRIDRRRTTWSPSAPTNRLVDRTDPAIVAAIAADPTVRDIVNGYTRWSRRWPSAVVGPIATALPSPANDAGEHARRQPDRRRQLAATATGPLGGAQSPS